MKTLAKDTAIYGLSSIIGRFLNYLLVPLYTYKIAAASGGYGVITNLYAYTALLLVVIWTIWPTFSSRVIPLRTCSTLASTAASGSMAGRTAGAFPQQAATAAAARAKAEAFSRFLQRFIVSWFQFFRILKDRDNLHFVQKGATFVSVPHPPHR